MYSTVHEQTCQLSTPDCLDRILRASWLGAKTPYRGRTSTPVWDCASFGLRTAR